MISAEGEDYARLIFSIISPATRRRPSPPLPLAFRVDLLLERRRHDALSPRQRAAVTYREASPGAIMPIALHTGGI